MVEEWPNGRVESRSGGVEWRGGGLQEPLGENLWTVKNDFFPRSAQEETEDDLWTGGGDAGQDLLGHEKPRVQLLQARGMKHGIKSLSATKINYGMEIIKVL